jgi:hypothetical protein
MNSVKGILIDEWPENEAFNQPGGDAHNDGGKKRGPKQ